MLAASAALDVAGKGSRRRPTDESAYRDNFDRIFNKQEKPVASNTTYVLRKAAVAYEQNNGVLPLDIMVALEHAGLVIEDVINYMERNEIG